MADAWDDSDDDWEKDDDDDELTARLQKAGIGGVTKVSATPEFDDEDLALKEKELKEKEVNQELKRKGNALMEKKMAEQERLMELEVARKAMQLEAEMESTLSPDEVRKMKRQQIEEADHALTDDLFGGIDNQPKTTSTTTATSDNLVLKDLKDHLKHARRVGMAIKQHGKVLLAASFLKEAIQECKDVLDEAAVSDIIKTCNIIKNDIVQAAKRKTKFQAQKSKKVDKVAEAKARLLQKELYGDNDKYDRYDEVGADYEDSFF